MEGKLGKRSRVKGPTAVLAGWLLRVLGWGIEGGQCTVDKCVIIGMPHRTNWDFFYTLLAAFSTRLPIWLMIKDTLFWWPLGILMRRLGGVPVNRRASTSVVTQVAESFKTYDKLYLVMTPSGTRKKVDYLKSGFYWIAHEAGVPIWPWYITYERKMMGSGPLIYTTGDIEADLARLRAYYEEKTGPMPECRPAPKKDGGPAA